MKIAEVMTRGVEFISPDATPQEAARKMSVCHAAA
jgi:CBS domain-containing protein